MNQKYNITYYGSYNTGSEYSRTDNTLLALKTAGHKVTECHYPLWKNRNSRQTAAGSGWIKIILRNCFAQLILLTKYLAVMGRTDIIFVGTACYNDIIQAYLLAKVSGALLIFDSFYSLYDTIVIDRKMYSKKSLIAKMLWKYEQIVYKMPDLIFTDTMENGEWIREMFDIKCRIAAYPPGVPSGFLESLSCAEHSVNNEEDSFICVFYGSFVPLQGADVIVRAAEILAEHDNIVFRMIGDGQDKEKCTRLAAKYALANLEFLPWMTVEELAVHVMKANLCLGIFGDTGKAERVVPYKIYSYMAAGKPIVTQNTKSVQAVLRNYESVYLTERSSAESLADSILKLAGDPAMTGKLGRGAYSSYLETSTIESIALTMMKPINDLVALHDRKKK